MKYCPYCGAAIADSAASFCAECGKTLPIVTEEAPGKKRVKPESDIPQKKKHVAQDKRKSKKKPAATHLRNEKIHQSSRRQL